jgi:hypothetical protein
MSLLSDACGHSAAGLGGTGLLLNHAPARSIAKSLCSAKNGQVDESSGKSPLD